MTPVSTSPAPYAELLRKVFDLTGRGLSKPLAESLLSLDFPESDAIRGRAAFARRPDSSSPARRSKPWPPLQAVSGVVAQRRADFRPRGTLVPPWPPLEYAPISLRGKVFEALATRCLKTLKSQGLAKPGVSPGSPIFIRSDGPAGQRVWQLKAWQTLQYHS